MDDIESQVKILGSAEIILDKEKNLKIIDDVPTFKDVQGRWSLPGTEMLTIPNEPYVFTVDQLKASDKDHRIPVVLNDIKVIMAHAVRSGNTWRFLGGGEVAGTVNAYNRYAQQQKINPIEFVVACNSDEPHPLGIRVGEFDADQNIAYAVGENVHVARGQFSSISLDGKVYLDVSVEQTFFGLNQLVRHREISSNIRLLGS